MIIEICKSIANYGVSKFYVLNTGVSTNRALQVARLEGGSHAEEIETSMMLYLDPEIVNMNLAKKDFQPNRGSGLTRNSENLKATFSPTGAWGDPTLATVEKGKIIVDALVARILADIRALIAI